MVEVHFGADSEACQGEVEFQGVVGLHFLEGVRHVEGCASVGIFTLGHSECFCDFEHVRVEGDDEECGADGFPGAGVDLV